jgi:hypothetical protein
MQSVYTVANATDLMQACHEGSAGGVVTMGVSSGPNWSHLCCVRVR